MRHRAANAPTDWANRRGQRQRGSDDFWPAVTAGGVRGGGGAHGAGGRRRGVRSGQPARSRVWCLFSSRRRHTSSVSAFLLNRSSDLEMAATETITSIILIKLIRVSLGTVRHPRRFKIVVIDIQITLKQMLRDFIGIRVNRAKKSGMVNITSSVNSRERSGINT